MAEPISIATALTWGMKAVGWVVSPTLSAVIKEAYIIFKIDPGDKLSLLNLKIVQLEVMLTRGEAEVLRHKKILDPLLENLKSAFYEVEEFLDLLDYNCLEKQALDLSNDKSNVSDNLQKWLNKQASSFKSNDVPPGLSKRKLKKLLNKIECIVNAAQHTLLNLPQASLDNMPLPPSSHNLRSTGMPKSKVIGRDADVDNIVARLHEQEESAMSTSHYSVIGIHGIAGSGKTTLAQAIFAHEKKLACHFDKCIWIHVSQDFDLDSICRDLIQAVTGGLTHVSLSDFEQILDDQLDGKRYLLVLDDVWYQPRDANCSEQLRILPPKTAGKRGSKVLVTSRSSEAALVLGALKHNCIAISELDDNSFNELFMHYALGNSCLNENDMGQYQECGARIATKLKKSPLLARAVGVQLYLRHNIDFWRRAESRNLLDDLMGALWWSYLHLPVPVRRCFAFCGIFPRRRLIYRDELIQMWIAAGFIRGTTEEDLESVANDYFDDLVSISFFQPGFLGSWQIRKFYVLHDLLHDLAVKVSGSDIFTIEFGWEGKIPPTVRHLFVKNRYLNMVEMVKPLKVLRTLVLDNANIDDSMLIALPKLRILSVPVRGLPRLPLIQLSRSTCMLRVPDSIAKLKHLRYVSFTGNFDSAEIHFPKNFAKLYHLEVLKFGCRSSVMFNFGKENVCYSNLRHLISSKGQLDVPYIGRARSLVTLDHFTSP